MNFTNEYLELSCGLFDVAIRLLVFHLSVVFLNKNKLNKFFILFNFFFFFKNLLFTGHRKARLEQTKSAGRYKIRI